MNEQPNTDPDLDPELLRLRKMMERDPTDVRRVMRLARFGTEGQGRYLIETPFASLPRCVIGTTNLQFEEVRHEYKCGAEWSAPQAWDRLMAGQSPLDPPDINTSRLYA